MSWLACWCQLHRQRFVAGLGLSPKPEFARACSGLGLPTPMTEMAARTEELATLPVRPRSALVVENEITYLSVPVPSDGLVVWGKGFDVDRVGRLPWLSDVDVAYWGDLDTHGFAILDRLRAFLPHARSLLMDRVTLLQHRDRWGVEPSPARSRLTRLTRAEADLYADWSRTNPGDRVRLEQSGSTGRASDVWGPDGNGRRSRVMNSSVGCFAGQGSDRAPHSPGD